MLEAVDIALQKEEVVVVEGVEVVPQHLTGHRGIEPAGVVMAFFQKFRDDATDLPGFDGRGQFSVRAGG